MNWKKWQAIIIAGGVLLLLFAAVFKYNTKSAIASYHKNVSLHEVPILNYHKVDILNNALSVSPREFEEQMEYLSENGYHTITPDELLAYLSSGKELPDKPIMLTFDDGYLDNYTNAFPIMKKYGFTATIFVVTNLVNHDERFMTWEQIREMQNKGFVFGSHTVKHISLTTLTKEEVMNELAQSRDEIEKQLGKVPKYFAYPTGTYNKEIEDMVKKAGYKAAFTIDYGQVGADSDLYLLQRIPIFKEQRTFRSFFIRLNGAPILEELSPNKS